MIEYIYLILIIILAAIICSIATIKNVACNNINYLKLTILLCLFGAFAPYSIYYVINIHILSIYNY